MTKTYTRLPYSTPIQDKLRHAICIEDKNLIREAVSEGAKINEKAPCELWSFEFGQFQVWENLTPIEFVEHQNKIDPVNKIDESILNLLKQLSFEESSKYAID